MVRSTLLMLVICAMFSMFTQPALVNGDTTASGVSEKTHKAWESFKAYVIDQKHEAVQHGKELLKEADAKIEKLKSKAAKASGDTKVQYQKSIEKLQKMRANTSKKLDKLEKSSANTWESTKHGFAEAYKDLHNAYKEATKK